PVPRPQAQQRHGRQRPRPGGAPAQTRERGGRTVIASLSEYLPLGDLGKIVLVCLFVAVVAPSAVSLGIVGLGQRTPAVERHSSAATGTLLIVVALAILGALIGVGLYALVNR